jgi:hypothetical protein
MRTEQAQPQSIAPDGLARERTNSTGAVRRQLGQPPPLELGAGDCAGEPVRTRFVVDMISGTSA